MQGRYLVVVVILVAEQRIILGFDGCWVGTGHQLVLEVDALGVSSQPIVHTLERRSVGTGQGVISLPETERPVGVAHHLAIRLILAMTAATGSQQHSRENKDLSHSFQLVMVRLIDISIHCMHSWSYNDDFAREHGFRVVIHDKCAINVLLGINYYIFHSDILDK